MFKIRGAVSRVKDLPKYLQTNSYSFTAEEVGITSLPRSLFIPTVISVSGSTPAFIIGSALTASSVMEWGVPLLAAAAAGLGTPLGMYFNRQKKLRREVAEGLSSLLPQLIFEGAPAITEDHAALLLQGKAVEVRLGSGSVVAIRLGSQIKGSIDAKTAGTVYLTPGNQGTQEFDTLLDGIASRNPAVAKALQAGAAKTTTRAIQASALPALPAANAPVRNYLLNIRGKAQQPNP